VSFVDSVTGVTAARGGGLRVLGFTGGGHCGPRHAERLRAAGATGIGPGVRLAATPALLTATALAGGWTIVEASARPISPGLGVWVAWLIVPLAHLVAPGRWTRLATGVALALTVAVVPLAAVLGTFRPALYALLPQAALGLVVLGLPDRPPIWLRLTPPAGAAALLPVVAALQHDDGGLVSTYYGWAAGRALLVTGMILLLVALLLAAGLATRHDFRGAWALLVLLGPIGMLSLHAMAEELAVRLYGGGPNATWTTLLASAVAVAVVTAVVVPLAVTVAGRRS
jgi:hypothetical protein